MFGDDLINQIKKLRTYRVELGSYWRPPNREVGELLEQEVDDYLISISQGWLFWVRCTHSFKYFVITHNLGQKRYEKLKLKRRHYGFSYEFSCSIPFKFRQTESNCVSIKKPAFKFLVNKITDFLASSESVDSFRLYSFMESYLGEGSFASVWKTQNSNAIKVLGRKASKPDFMVEIAILQNLSHPNVIKYLGKGSLGKTYYYKMELADKMLAGVNDLSPSDKEKICCDISKGVAYLHSLNVFHGDLSPYNVLLTIDDGYTARIADFGTSLILKTKTWSDFAFTTKEFQPFDFQTNPSYTFAFEYDVWSMGCIFFQVVNGYEFNRVVFKHGPPLVHSNKISEAAWKCFGSPRSNASEVSVFLTRELYSPPVIDESRVIHIGDIFISMLKEMGIS